MIHALFSKKFIHPQSENSSEILMNNFQDQLIKTYTKLTLSSVYKLKSIGQHR